MSLDDTENAEIELHELVTEVLEDNGLLSKIRAQLRAGLYLALENDINESENYKDYNSCLKSRLRDPDISLIFCLVREFLEYFELSCTASVFDKETFFGSAYSYESREKLAECLDIGINAENNGPLLLHLLNVVRCKNTAQESTKVNENADVHNSTYDIPSMLEKSNTEVSEYSESANDTPQIIGVKTVLKENLKNTERSLSASVDEPGEQNSVENKEDLNQMPDKSAFEIDDTYEGTSSIAEDSVFSGNKEPSMLIDFEKTLRTPSITQSTPTRTLIDQTIDDNKSPRSSASPEQSAVSSDKKSVKHDKTDRGDKLKPMSVLASLSELSPLQINKNRSNDKPLLPSLYTKDFREKSSLKEVDTLVELNYDSYDNYEEDFTSSGSLDNDSSLNNGLNAKEGSAKLKSSSESHADNLNANELSTEKNNDANSNSVRSITLDDAQETSF